MHFSLWGALGTVVWLTLLLAGCGGGGEEMPTTPPPTLAPTISTTRLPDGTVGIAYPTTTLIVLNGQAPFTWSLAMGTMLPPGLILDSSTGQISGTPTTVGTFMFTLQVSDAQNRTDTQDFTVAIGDTTALVTLLSVATDGTISNGDSGSPAVSDDGRFVAFTSFGTVFVQVIPQTLADIFSNTTIGNSALALTPDAHSGQRVELVAGSGTGQSRLITANTATTFTVDTAWNPVPDATTVFRVSNDTNNVTDIFLRDRTCNTTTRVSVASNGAAANDDSFTPALSALVGGTTLFVAYISEANNLVDEDADGMFDDDTNGTRDVYVTAVDVSGCTLTPLSTVRASRATDGTEANSVSNLPTLSSDGTLVAYHSLASTLAPADANGTFDAFVSTLQFAGGVLSLVETQRVTFRLTPAQGVPRTTADIFSDTTIGSVTLSLTPGTLVGQEVEILFGAGAGQTRTITTNTATTLTVSTPWTVTPNNTSIFHVTTSADLTADIFSDTTIGNSTLTMTPDEHLAGIVEIVAGTGAGQSRDVTDNDTTTFTVSPAWNPIPDATSIFRLTREGFGSSVRARLSGDGAFVAFSHPLVSGQDVALQDRATGFVSNLSLDTQGETANGASSVSAINPNGNLVLFQSGASDLVTGDTNNAADLFLRDRGAATTTRVSLANDGSEPNRVSDIVAGLSGGGAVVAFSSFASNLVDEDMDGDLTNDDRNGVRDVFLRDSTAPETRRLSRGMGGINPNNESFDPAISRDASTVAFGSSATNLVPNDTNGFNDVFVVTTGLSNPIVTVIPKLPPARQGVPYAAALRAFGGEEPLFWALREGALPPGLFLDPQTGQVSGLPQKAGRYVFTVLVLDAARPARSSQARVALLVQP